MAKKYEAQRVVLLLEVDGLDLDSVLDDPELSVSCGLDGPPFPARVVQAAVAIGEPVDTLGQAQRAIVDAVRTEQAPGTYRAVRLDWETQARPVQRVELTEEPPRRGRKPADPPQESPDIQDGRHCSPSRNCAGGCGRPLSPTQDAYCSHCDPDMDGIGMSKPAGEEGGSDDA